MRTFDINRVIDKYGLDAKNLAALLFPNAKHPYAALKRILDKKANLDVHQLEKLASYIRVPISELFCESAWKGEIRNGVLLLCKDGYEVKFIRNEVFDIEIYKDNELLRTTNCAIDSPMSSIIDNLNKIID